jgi:protein TonB
MSESVSFSLQDLHSRRRTHESHRFNASGLAATGFVHLLVACALIFQWQFHKPKPAESLIFVQIAEEKAEKPIETPPTPKLETPEVDLPPLRLPEIQQQTNAITPPPIRATTPPPSAAADVNVVETYQARLMRHLNNYKRYPVVSEKRREEGVALLSFTINAKGDVLTSRIVRSSGHPRLDEETLQVAQRASPVPPPPAELWTGPTREITVPINFAMRQIR